MFTLSSIGATSCKWLSSTDVAGMTKDLHFLSLALLITRNVNSHISLMAMEWTAIEPAARAMPCSAWIGGRHPCSYIVIT